VNQVCSNKDLVNSVKMILEQKPFGTMWTTPAFNDQTVTPQNQQFKLETRDSGLEYDSVHGNCRIPFCPSYLPLHYME
jgi:hypothetical protein